jgi:hypothetical protein
MLLSGASHNSTLPPSIELLAAGEHNSELRFDFWRTVKASWALSFGNLSGHYDQARTLPV